MSYTINGEIYRTFADLVDEFGYFIASEVFADIISRPTSWIDIDSGETGTMPPEPVNEGTLFNENGWIDLCRHAEEISRRNPGARHLGDSLYPLFKAARGRR